MCFSAPASFVASGVLAAIGTAIVVRTKHKRLLPLALIPLWFAIQQAAEGFVWLGLPNPSSSKNLYLFFAYSFWPFWIPLAMWISETQKLRKQLLALCFGIGVTVAIALGLLIPETTAEAYTCSIHYSNTATNDSLSIFAQILYAIATLAPPFISSIPRMWALGALAVVFGGALIWIDQLLFVSMWCFFAAIFSLALFFILKPSAKKR
jgi:hypothetical protein